jgi:hypothetical protein
MLQLKYQPNTTRREKMNIDDEAREQIIWNKTELSMLGLSHSLLGKITRGDALAMFCKTLPKRTKEAK